MLTQFSRVSLCHYHNNFILDDQFETNTILIQLLYFLCCVVLYCIVLCCIVLYCIVLCCVVLCCVVLCCVVLCFVALCCAVLCCSVLCCALLRYVVLCCVLLCCVVFYCAIYVVVLCPNSLFHCTKQPEHFESSSEGPITSLAQANCSIRISRLFITFSKFMSLRDFSDALTRSSRPSVV